MKQNAQTIKTEPILVDRGANYFGTAGAGFHLKANLRGNGCLALTEEALTFDPYGTGGRIEIPVAEIEELGVGLWHRMKTRGVPVLKVTHHRNLVFGVVVADPTAWIDAIHLLTAGRSRVQRRRVPREEIRRFRLIVTAFLVLILFLTVVLPLLYTWVSSQALREVAPSSGRSSRTGTVG